ncbi:MAG: SUMF1/EgtB/PvdO family nonheme iron enzyme [Candidatus Alcyoniella australis]|nr:SUMF1/EgtB/PvdO family nonheme iron enzyme [Candidatus Alcyoniella australis]
MDSSAIADLKRPGRAGWLLVLLAALLLGGPALWLPLGRDQGIGLYIADVLLHGGAPYSDAWEIRPPGVFYVYASWIALLGKGGLALRLGDLLWQAATGLALFGLGRRLFNTRVGTWSGVLYLAAYYLGNNFWNLGNTDSLAALPSALALIALLPKSRGPRWSWDLLAGLLMAAVFLVRFTQGLIYLPVLALIFGQGLRLRPYGLFARVGRTAVLSVGFCVGLAAFAMHLVALGAWDDFFYTLFVFAPKYAVLTYQGQLAEFLRFALGQHCRFVLDQALIAVPGLIAAAWLLLRDRRAHGLALCAWLVATVLGMDVMGKFYAYHWLPLLAPLAMLAAVFVDRVMVAFTTRRLVWALAGAAILVVCALSFVGRYGGEYVTRISEARGLATGTLSQREHLARFDSIEHGGDFSATANYLGAEFLRQHTAPGEPIYIWGFETLIYYLADRPAPTRFCSNYPIVASWHRQDWYEELLRDLRAARPKYVLLVSGDSMPWINGHAMDSLTALRRDFPELRQWIEGNYEVQTTIENIHFCRRIQAAPQPEPATVGNLVCPEGMALLSAAAISVGHEHQPKSWEREPQRIEVPTFCMDIYEYPNHKGVEPRNYVNWHEAGELCAQQGKRLCTEDEWDRACSGVEGREYCYGDRLESSRCNWGGGDGQSGPRRPSGSFPECVTPEGIFDLNGNLSEWTSTPFDQEGYRRMYILRGGTSWWSDWYGQDCTSRHRHFPEEGTYSDDGLRCCADPAQRAEGD